MIMDGFLQTLSLESCQKIVLILAIFYVMHHLGCNSTGSCERGNEPLYSIKDGRFL
jgi:hypothetical protein